MTEDKNTPTVAQIDDWHRRLSRLRRHVLSHEEADELASVINTMLNEREAAVQCAEAARQYVLGKAPDGKALLAALSAYDAVKEG